MSGSNIDALPYFDKQVENPGVKAQAQSLIDAELAQTPQVVTDDPRLPPEAGIFTKTPHLAELLDGYPSAPIKGIDTSKYGVPTVEAGATVEELKEAEKRGRTGEGHMGLRVENANILASYGPNAWLVRNYQLNAELTELQSTLTALKEEVTDVNRKRRQFQEDTGEHLKRLEGRWQNLVGTTVQLELATRAIEGELVGLRRKEEQLQQEVAALEG